MIVTRKVLKVGLLLNALALIVVLVYNFKVKDLEIDGYKE